MRRQGRAAARWQAVRSGAALYLAVASGAALGGVARALASMAALSALGPGFAWGTLAVNVAGSFLIGFYATLTEPGGRLLVRPRTRQFVTTGFCGGFTTFSMFSLETLRLLAARDYPMAATNVAVSVAAWLVAVWAGAALAARLNRLPAGRTR